MRRSGAGEQRSSGAGFRAIAPFADRLRRSPVPLLSCLIALGCGRPEPHLEVSGVTAPSQPGFGNVMVRGLQARLARGLSAVPPTDPRWHDALAVRVSSGADHLPPLAGRYSVTDQGELLFEPWFPPEGFRELRVRLDPAALARLGGRPIGDSAIREWRLSLAAPAIPGPSAVVRGVFPAASVVPANLLRWYVEFSAPMREGEASRRAHLLDASGREVAGAFLSLDQELWDPAGRRLTLLFDPGRVKRGIRTRREAGPVLRPGHRYTLVIDGGWRDARGSVLLHGFRHGFRAGAPDLEPIVVRAWRLTPPPIGSSAPLQVDFGKPLDHALAERLLEVRGPDERRLRGGVTLLAGDRHWQFVPDAPWQPGEYRLLAHPALEDPAGNRIGHVFDADLRAGGGEGSGTGALGRSFHPVGEETSP